MKRKLMALSAALMLTGCGAKVPDAVPKGGYTCSYNGKPEMFLISNGDGVITIGNANGARAELFYYREGNSYITDQDIHFSFKDNVLKSADSKKGLKNAKEYVCYEFLP